MDKEQLDDWLTREPDGEDEGQMPSPIRALEVTVGWLKVEVDEAGLGRVTVTNEHGAVVILEELAHGYVSLAIGADEVDEIARTGEYRAEVSE